MKDDVRVVFVTVPSADAAGLARHLVETRVAACVNILPGIRSMFRWEGEIQEEEEVLLVLKTAALRWDDLVREIQAHHPYDVPEVIALPVRRGLEPYLDWVRAEVDAAEEGEDPSIGEAL